MTDYTYTINGTDFSDYVDRDTYTTGLIPVYGEKITTLDGVDHVTVLRHKGVISHGLNALTQTELKTLAATLVNAPLTVSYYCQQRGEVVTAKMLPNEQTARRLVDCLYGNDTWHEVGNITLTEL